MKIIRAFQVSPGYACRLPGMILDIDDVIAENWIALGRCERVEEQQQEQQPPRRKKETASKRKRIETR